VQELVITARVLRYRRERWLTPEGKTIVAPLPDGSRRHRQQRVQVERAGPAGADARNREIVASADGLAQLADDDAGTGDAQCAWLPRRRDQEVEHILLDPIEVELPGNDPPPRPQPAGTRSARRPAR
jgi:hypothetical protein